MVKVDTQRTPAALQTPPPQQVGEEAKTSTYASTAFKIVAFPFQAAATLTKNTISVITSVALAILGVPGRVFNAAKGLLFSAKTEESSSQEAVKAETTETVAEPKGLVARVKELATLKNSAIATATVLTTAAVAFYAFDKIAAQQASVAIEYGYNFFAELMGPQTSPVAEAAVEHVANTTAPIAQVFTNGTSLLTAVIASVNTPKARIAQAFANSAAPVAQAAANATAPIAQAFTNGTALSAAAIANVNTPNTPLIKFVGLAG